MNQKKVVLVCISILITILTLLCIINNEIIISLFFTVLLTVSIILLVKELFEDKDKYRVQVNKIIKKYNSILIGVDSIPKLSDKEIIITNYFNDLINIELELKKPVYYIRKNNTCDFILMTKDEAYVFMMKRDNKYKSDLLKYIESKSKDEEFIKKEYKAIDNLDETSIIVINGEKKYKVSPLKKKK